MAQYQVQLPAPQLRDNHLQDFFGDNAFMAAFREPMEDNEVMQNAAMAQDWQEHANQPQNAAAAAVSDDDAGDEYACWVFAYGSLCWNPGFEYDKCITGYVRGYVRRFWQGNNTHRGTKEQPGRVATLIEDKKAITWGCAYRIRGETALEYLKKRECTLGGYTTLELKFYPRVASYDTPFSGEAIEVLAYIATDQNEQWLGPADLDVIANNIFNCRGHRGHNVEYLLRLANFMREEIPDVHDEHLFELERRVMELLQRHKTPLWLVMGTEPEKIRRDSHEDIKRQLTFEFTSRIPEPKLRCLNI